ncbi:unnamed protein product [Phytomonas sp. EM1]|nr:unnamed protein product [Phytomonas sp. EM1]|eukprot:CCW64439.1 unnamed protein product [Phytomonas sp. isolate EM1]
MGENLREDMLSNYKELQKGLSETLAMQSEDDEEVEALIHEFEEQLQVLAAALNDGETIEVTPNLHKVELPNGAGNIILYPPPTAKSDGEGGSENQEATSSPGASLQCAPYEIFYDDREWYPCVITEVVPPARAIDRVRYRAHVLGYPVEDVVFSESLRSWRATTIGAQLRSGAACHAIHPTSGVYKPANVVRLTLDGTVIVSFAKENSAEKGEAAETTAPTHLPDASEGEENESKDRVEVEIPLSHVHVGHFYPVLRKRPQLTEEEREARRVENAQRKRNRIQLEKQLKMDRIAQDANDWKAMMGDLMGARPNKKPKR